MPQDGQNADGAAVGPPAPSRLDRKEKAAGDALRGLIRDCQADEFGPREPLPAAFELTLRLRVDPAADWQLAADAPLRRQIADQLGEAQAGRSPFVDGRVHCFRCRTSICEHGAPPAGGYVFRGYSSTGQPEWHELVQAFIAARDERVDQLYAAPPRVLALSQSGHELKAQQLGSFGRASRSYSILGQCVCGYYAAPGAERVALTLQAVETREADGQVTLRLNAVPSGIAPDDWRQHLAADGAGGVGDAIARGRQALEILTGRLREARRDGAPAEDLRRLFSGVPHVLRQLARAIEQKGRRTSRRTRHAEQRRGDRPVHKALDDALSAAAESFFLDERPGTVAVCGPQGRVHVFNLQGRHVTSLRLAPGSVELRLRRQRWRPLPPEETARLRALLRQLAAGEAPEPTA